MHNANQSKVLLKEKGLKITKGRLAVLDVLRTSATPLSVEEILQKLKRRLDVVSIYRILERFKISSLVEQTDFHDGRAYFEYQSSHHHHIVCKSCKTIEHLNVCIREQEKKALKASKKFQSIGGHTLEFFGTCQKCAKI
ncbi:MAG: Fur family transcriptional regulator [Candidatus Harrisonbacteria bacterium]|nr:Fur family transcriptional regulator [Candidatus Harrisonbacteria bacterium]